MSTPTKEFPVDPLKDPFHDRLHHLTPGLLDPETAQSSGMRRLGAVSGKTVGSRNLWMGQTHVAPGLASANHHHGESETAIYVVSGNPEFVFLEGEGDEAQEVRIRTKAGDYVFVPPFVPHREENPDPLVEALVVIARSTQEAIVVNLPDLRPVGRVLTTSDDVTSSPPTSPGVAPGSELEVQSQRIV